MSGRGAADARRALGREAGRDLVTQTAATASRSYRGAHIAERRVRLTTQRAPGRGRQERRVPRSGRGRNRCTGKWTSPPLPPRPRGTDTRRLLVSRRAAPTRPSARAPALQDPDHTRLAPPAPPSRARPTRRSPGGARMERVQGRCLARPETRPSGGPAPRRSHFGLGRPSPGRPASAREERRVWARPSRPWGS